MLRQLQDCKRQVQSMLRQIGRALGWSRQSRDAKDLLSIYKVIQIPNQRNEQMMTLEVGQEAPDFTLQNQFGEDVKLSDFRGKQNVVLVFYPMAFTGICTGELCEIRDQRPAFVSNDVQVLGISCDTTASLKAFAEQEKFDYFQTSGHTAKCPRPMDHSLSHEAFQCAALSSSTRQASCVGQ
jgi:peroxiredoxin